MSQKRDHFRIVFPLGQRPCLAAGMSEWEVIDLSEDGAKIALNCETSLCSDNPFAATIRFHDGTPVTVTATVQRREDEYVILNFAKPLPYSLIMAEQRRLLRLFPRESLLGPLARAPQPIPPAVTAAP
jgi:hypothetical protein